MILVMINECGFGVLSNEMRQHLEDLLNSVYQNILNIQYMMLPMSIQTARLVRDFNVTEFEKHIDVVWYFALQLTF